MEALAAAAAAAAWRADSGQGLLWEGLLQQFGEAKQELNVD